MDEMKWYKSDKKCPTLDMRARPHIINTNDGWLHFIGGNKYHFKLLVDDIVPNELHMTYNDRSNSLVIGYIKSIQKQYDLYSTFNKDLVLLLKSFYPKFGM